MRAASTLPRRVFLAGGHITRFIGGRHPDFIHKKHANFGKKENPSIEDYIQEAVNGALADAKCDASLVEKAWIGNFAGELFVNQGHLGAAVVGSNPKLMHKPVMRVEAACASGGLAVASAFESIQAGTNIALAVGAEVQTTVPARQGGEFLARASHFRRQRSIDDFTFPCLFARRVKHCIANNIVTEEDLARLAAKAYANANLNPLAHMHHVKLSYEAALKASDTNPNFLSNEEFKPFMKISDCSQVSDGGAGLVLVSEAGLQQLGIPRNNCVEIVALSVATGNLYEDADFLTMDTTNAAAKRAYEMAGINPSHIHVAEVHDCFTVTEILMYEALGLAAPGQGAKLVRDGTTSLDGSVPVNTGGGLVGFGHPVGATGVKQLVEIYRQMKGKCGAYQMKSIPSVGVTANMGGDDKTAVVTVIRNLA
eukprot:c12763_g1_i1.p1 GENE.c12763_g1_i1~~c12763_g1_i1.p1  ORF type:complete len:443 (+),score=130.43 c12763_g1_i1:56-1330(+)